jgi:hypothetical protein
VRLAVGGGTTSVGLEVGTCGPSRLTQRIEGARQRVAASLRSELSSEVTGDLTMVWTAFPLGLPA